MTQSMKPGQPNVPDSNSRQTLEAIETRATMTQTNIKQKTAKRSQEEDNNSPIHQTNEIPTIMLSQSDKANSITTNAQITIEPINEQSNATQLYINNRN
jgi:hypothetical protein